MNQKLVSVEIQKEFDITNKEWQEQVFIKLYVAARTSGFLADISDRNWKTLCVLATFMDTQGECYPTQVQIAEALGISRQTANERINSLLKYQWQGKPVVTVAKVRKNARTGKKGERWDNNRYTILPLSNLGFGYEQEKPMSAKPDIGKNHDITEEKPMSGNADTNKIHNNVVVVVKEQGKNLQKIDTVVGESNNCATNQAEKINTCSPSEITQSVAEFAGAAISKGFANEISEKFTREQIETMLSDLRRQVSKPGFAFKSGVGAWIRAWLWREYMPDVKPPEPEKPPRPPRQQSTPRTRTLPDRRHKAQKKSSDSKDNTELQRRKEIYKTLYMG